MRNKSFVTLTELFLAYKRMILLCKSSRILVLLGMSIESRSFQFLSLGLLKRMSFVEVLKFMFWVEPFLLLSILYLEQYSK